MASHGSKTVLLDNQRTSPLPVLDAARRNHRHHAPDEGVAERCRAVLDQLMRQTVISRIQSAHSDAAPSFSAALVAVAPIDAGDTGAAALHVHVADLVRALCDAGQATVDDLVEANVQHHGIEALVMDMMPEMDAALRARGSASPATMLGHWRLQEMLERVSARFQLTATVRPHGIRLLIGSPEPQSPALRLLLAAECLTREGWNVRCESPDVHGDAGQADPSATEPRSAPDLCRIVAGEWFGLAVIAADGTVLNTLSADLRALRSASCNPGLRVLVISEALTRRPDRMARLGADAAAADLRHACTQAARLRGLLVRPD